MDLAVSFFYWYRVVMLYTGKTGFRLAVFYEMFILGLCVIAIESVVYRIFTGEFPTTALSHFWPMIASGMIVGASIHLIFEVTGINEKWCRVTYKV